MKTLVVLLAVCLTAAVVTAQDPQPQTRKPQDPQPQYRYPQYRVPHRSNDSNAGVVEEKRFQALAADGELFWMDSTNGELWRFDPVEPGWDFLGRPRGAGNRRKGTYLLQPYKPGELLILDTDSGEAWWIRGATWVRIDDPSTRKRRDESPRSWDRMWEQFKNP